MKLSAAAFCAIKLCPANPVYAVESRKKHFFFATPSCKVKKGWKFSVLLY
jgi:hypothetical protein